MLCRPRFTIDDRAVDNLDVKEFSFPGAVRWVGLAMLFSGLGFGRLMCCFVCPVVGGSLRSFCWGRSEWLLGGLSWVVTSLLVASSSLFGVIGSVCSDLSDLTLICGDGVLGCVPFPAPVLGGPLLALDDE